MRAALATLAILSLCSVIPAQAQNRNASPIVLVDSGGRTVGRLNGTHVLLVRGSGSAWGHVLALQPADQTKLFWFTGNAYFAQPACGGQAYILDSGPISGIFPPPGAPVSTIVKGPGTARFLYVATGAAQQQLTIYSSFDVQCSTFGSPQSMNSLHPAVPVNISTFTEPFTLR